MTSSVPFLASDPDEYEHFMARWSRCLAGPFLQFAGIRAGERVLDVGCGTGVLALALAEHGAKAIGIDASEPYLDGARRHRSHPSRTSWPTRATSLTRTILSMAASRYWPSM
jgi:2-polyprenyl-3-methyl-5-hydroxy-6-metoxy-1,4-benzoquinol methylase